ncbi:MAG: tetratricopeptide repeat protein [Chloroflexi bacterium]|nr:tetratricopeptide repeat protein [Chloroflexota bacterium]
MLHTNRSPDHRHRSDATATFFEQLKFALEHYHEPARIGEHSPFAQPYFLGQALHRHADAITPRGRGSALCKELASAALALWAGPLPTTQAQLLQIALQAKEDIGLCDRYHYLLLDLTYFHHSFARARNQAEIYDEILHVARATYDRHLREAIQRLGEMLLLRLQPTLPLEQPVLNVELIGRDAVCDECLATLYMGSSVYLCGMSGIGKTTVGVALAERWPTPAVFWFTVRLTLNDQLTSLIFALGNFLHQQGASRLWLQLMANGGLFHDANLALELTCADLAALTAPPLLCFDEVDLLRPLDSETESAQHTQFLAFLEGLHNHAPLLLMGQRAVLPTDVVYPLTRLTSTEMATWLTHAGVAFSPALLARVETYTGGAPRLLALCLLLYRTIQAQTEITFDDVLDQLPQTPALAPIWQRLQQRLDKTERALLQALAVFRSAAPLDAWLADSVQETLRASNPDSSLHLQRLINDGLVQEDSKGGVALLPTLREVIYNQLSVEEREELHRQAGMIRAKRGEYTAAAYHYQFAGQLEAAIAIWQPHADQECRRGQAAAALAVFQQISAHRLSEATANTLHLLRSQLYQLCGQSVQALEELEPLKTKTDDWIVDAAVVGGDALRTLGETDAALVRYGDGLVAAARLLQQNTWLHAKRATVYIQQRELHNARREALLARYRLENFEGAIQETSSNYSEARQHYLEALSMAEMLDDKAGIALVQRNLGVLAMRQADAENAIHYHQQALAFYEQSGDRVRAEEVRSNLAGVYVQFKQFGAAGELAQQALAFFEARHNAYWIAQNTSNLANVYFELGNFAQAQQYAERTLAQEEPQSYPYALFTLGQVRLAQQRWDEATAYFAHVRQIAQQNEDYFLLAQLSAIQQEADEA